MPAQWLGLHSACIKQQCQPPWMRLLAADDRVVPYGTGAICMQSTRPTPSRRPSRSGPNASGLQPGALFAPDCSTAGLCDAALWFPGDALAGDAVVKVLYLLDNRYKENAMSTAACLASPGAEAQAPGSSQAEAAQTPLAAMTSVVGEHQRLIHDFQEPIAAAATQVPSADGHCGPLSMSAPRVCTINATVDPASAGSMWRQPDAPSDGRSALTADEHQPSAAASCVQQPALSLQECLADATVSGADRWALVSKVSAPALSTDLSYFECVLWQRAPGWVAILESLCPCELLRYLVF
jgi:hypothetical protein